jgi:hypothetical protein
MTSTIASFQIFAAAFVPAGNACEIDRVVLLVGVLEAVGTTAIGTPINNAGAALECRTQMPADYYVSAALKQHKRRMREAQRPVTLRKPRIRLLSSREHNVHRVLGGLVLRYGKSQRWQVYTGKQRLTLTQGDWCKCKVDGINQPSLQILPHSGNSSTQ